MKRLWNFVGDDDDPFGPGTDLIISLLAVFLVILVITVKRKSQFPPNIVITAAEGYDFPSGSAELPSSLETYISTKLAGKIDENIKEFDVDTVVVIGHTDGQAVNRSNSNLDGLVESVAAGDKSVKELSAGSNADLGLMRALAVVRRLQDIQKQRGRFKGLDPRKGFRVYSAGQLILKNGELAQPNPSPDKERRRIEIRFTKSGGG